MLPGVSKVGIATYTPMEDDNWLTVLMCRDSQPRRAVSVPRL